ncbi:MAG: ATP-dependent RecD-like DNA helicase, partial [Proteobacteria bacterium]|nr:ATP-dependent RecD-like DNA helicase [Pseudomonadota bacterium]
MNQEPETIFLNGQIERITFTSEDTGYTVARVKVQGRKELVTVVGSLMSPVIGELLYMKGEWIRHPKFGDQFRVSEFSSMIPESLSGIEKYLGSGLIKGVGPVMAERIVKKFGKKALDIIEKDIGKLSAVEGIGEKRIAMIRKAWEDQKEIRNVMLFLHAHDIGSGYALKIFRQYGNRAVALLKKNPYRLATDISGIGFVTADKIGAKLGFPKNSEERIESGIIYALFSLSEEGHVYYPCFSLAENSSRMLDVDEHDVNKGIERAFAAGKIVIEELEGDIQESGGNRNAAFLAKYHYCETGISELLKKLVNSSLPSQHVDPDKAVKWVQALLSINLAEKQLSAIRCALRSKVMVITGGPGTGKTTIINSVIKIFSRLKMKTMLAAPTGRAAKRMSEATGHEAKTIHRMLEFNIERGGFLKNEENPIDCDVLIVDESSMIDTILMFHLLKAVPLSAVLIFVGDINQLPSVGAGNVLSDIISSGLIPVVTLSEIFRQAKESNIIVNAHRINNGLMPLIKADKNGNDFYFIEQDNPERIVEIIRELVTERIPKRFGFDPFTDIQVLSPMHRGLIGASNLNNVLQEALNSGETAVVRGEKNYRPGDKVMQIRNNYDREVFNGDTGIITKIISEEHKMFVSYDKRIIEYDFQDLDEIILSYAVSVHKSQGSEYPAVVIPVHTQHYILLQRNLIYTAITRGRDLVVMVGTKKALAIGINKSKTQKRYTYLKNRL